MFNEKISMDCTEEQYQKYLKKELVKIGYEEDIFGSSLPIIVNNINGRNGVCGGAFSEKKHNHNRIYLGKFNAPLYLALAAVTDGDTYGRWKILNGTMFVRREETGNGYTYKDGTKVTVSMINSYWATTEELLEHFGKHEVEEHKISRSDLNRIYNIACPEWKGIISHWAPEIMGPFDDEGAISAERVDEMFKAATPEQIQVLNTIFKKEPKPEKNEYRVFMTRTVVQQAMLILEAKNIWEVEAMALKTVEEEDWDIRDVGKINIVEVERED